MRAVQRAIQVAEQVFRWPPMMNPSARMAELLAQLLGNARADADAAHTDPLRPGDAAAIDGADSLEGVRARPGRWERSAAVPSAGPLAVAVAAPPWPAPSEWVREPAPVPEAAAAQSMRMVATPAGLSALLQAHVESGRPRDVARTSTIGDPPLAKSEGPAEVHTGRGSAETRTKVQTAPASASAYAFGNRADSLPSQHGGKQSRHRDEQRLSTSASSSPTWSQSPMPSSIRNTTAAQPAWTSALAPTTPSAAAPAWARSGDYAGVDPGIGTSADAPMALAVAPPMVEPFIASASPPVPDPLAEERLLDRLLERFRDRLREESLRWFGLTGGDL